MNIMDKEQTIRLAYSLYNGTLTLEGARPYIIAYCVDMGKSHQDSQYFTCIPSVCLMYKEYIKYILDYYMRKHEVCTIADINGHIIKIY